MVNLSMQSVFQNISENHHHTYSLMFLCFLQFQEQKAPNPQLKKSFIFKVFPPCFSKLYRFGFLIHSIWLKTPRTEQNAEVLVVLI